MGPQFTHQGFECGYVISGRLRVELTPVGNIEKGLSKLYPTKISF